MKFGIIGSYERESTYKAVKDLGLDGLEFTINHTIDSAKFLDAIPDVKKKLDENGLLCLSTGRWGMKRVNDDGSIIPEALQHDKNVILGASLLDCPVFNCGCNYAKDRTSEENYEIATEYFSKLVEYGRDKNVKIAVYNCDWENFVIEPEQWDKILPAIPELGIKYDPSHSIEKRLTYDRYLIEMLNYADRFHHFHVKGCMLLNGIRYDDPPAGMDGIKWGQVFELLYTKDYAGSVCYEPHSKFWTGKKGRWGTEFSINYIRPFIMPDNYEGEMGSAYSL